MTKRLSVLLANEGTYPHEGGGVSTWCDILCRELADIDFYVLSITGNVNVSVRYDLPRNVRQLIHVPLWGTEEPAEYTLSSSPFADQYLKKVRTTPEAIERDFGPLFRQLLQGMEDPQLDLSPYGEAICGLYDFVQQHDYNTTFHSAIAWRIFQTAVRQHFAAYPEEYAGGAPPTAVDLRTAFSWLYNLFMVLNAPIPNTDVTHATIGASAGLASVIAKRKYGTPMLLTEHGVYLRERYIHISATNLSFYLKRFLIRLAVFFSRLCYSYADQISPVCSFNTRWEKLNGARDEQLRTIYNGINPAVFKPKAKPLTTRSRPTVVAAARIYPLKDILTMIRSADIARRSIPDVLYLVYGATNADPPYTERCRQLIAELGLEQTFMLAGFHPEPAEIYNEGDISVLSSISEGFPYVVLESLACRRPVAATDVGGVREALEGFGLIVRPRDPVALGEATVTLLRNDDLRTLLGRKGREEVLAKYRTEHSVGAYAESYRALAARGRPGPEGLEG